MEQIERIRQMEQQFEKALAATKSDAWKQDFADDESERLPKDLKRGVLSEDAIWNLLADSHELNQRLQEVATKLLNA